MNLIVVTDVFGKNQEIEEIIAKLAHQFSKIDIVDPYDGNVVDFKDENEAYCYFQKTCGLTKYAEHVFEVAKNRSDTTLLLGFSVGAAAIWKTSHCSEFHPRTKMIGFYGSQIRNLLEINPTIETHLFWPKSEDHFDVSALLPKFREKKLVQCLQTQYLHGFMNKKSKNFSAEGYIKHIEILNNYFTALHKDFTNSTMLKCI